MLTSDQQLEILNDFFAWSGGDLPQDQPHVIEYVLTSYPLDYSADDATSYLMTEILQS